MKIAERLVMVLLILTLLAGGAWIYLAVQHEQQEVRDAVARGEYEIWPEEEVVNPEDWRIIYPNTVPILIGSSTVEASVADNIPERIKGLSGTPFLPHNVVKLFAFGAYGEHSIWMKDMNYAIDIIWANKEGEIVYIEEDVSPDSYPKSFASPEPAWYVIETVSGFSKENDITVGDKVRLSE